MTDPESVEYVPRSISEIKRHYQHPRFVNLCGQTKTYRYEQPKIRLIPVVKEKYNGIQ